MSSPVPISQGFVNFLVNYLHFTIQKWALRKLLFFLTNPSSKTNPSWHTPYLLVATDATGIAQPLPAELGPLPLYQDDGGFYSVLGPSLSHATPQDQGYGSADGTLAYNCINSLATVSPHRNPVFCGSSKCPGNRFASLSFTSTNTDKRSTHLLPSLLYL